MKRFEPKFQVPALGETPSEEMIEWLHTLEEEWDGDDSGIVLLSKSPDAQVMVAGPCDWVVWDNLLNSATVISKDDMEGCANAEC